MPAPPRILMPGTTVFVTTRIQEGLPLIPAEHVKLIMAGILARAQSNFEVTICHYIFMGNHFHMLLVVSNPEAISSFMNQIKTESAHAINKLLGRKQRSVWVPRYDSPAVLTCEDVISKIVYIYTNPQKANLVEQIEHYPGLSSWHLFKNRITEFSTEWIQRPMVPELREKTLSIHQQQRLAKELKNKATIKSIFKLSPNAWMTQFGITDACEIAEINKRIITSIKEEETALVRTRLNSKNRLLEPLLYNYRPLINFIVLRSLEEECTAFLTILV